jgi:16S rRNA (cytosine1402-N4)-methyltransferase
MAGEVLSHLDVKDSGVYVDATVGLGGHSQLILRKLGPVGRLICIDRDERALELARGRLDDKRCVFIHSRFSEMAVAIEEYGKVDGVLLDFGVSMMQLKDTERGFSFDSDDPLDMRMDRMDKMTAEEMVNTWREKELADAIYKFGEEGRSRRIARAIVTRRSKGRIRTCRELADTVLRAVAGRRGRTHPATRTFQALRIVVNDELGQIRAGLDSAVEVLKKGGRLVAISYHSLEDREVKVFLREAGRQGHVNVITKKPLTPSREEQRNHPSARSARLRCAEVSG